MNREDIIRMEREAGFGFNGASSPAIERFAALVAAASASVEREVILTILKGIDCTETEDPDGWWETSAGAEFGAGILDAIRARGQA